jgi:acylphosphatase
MERRRVVVSGRVQGVFFRDSCRQQAVTLGVRGWVRNREDGTVEAVFEGDERGIAAMVAWCREGPRHAIVTTVDVRAEPVEGLNGFVVRPY